MSFIRDMLPVFLFLIIADTITTIIALPAGYETNPVLSWGMANYGFSFLIGLKLVSIPGFYLCYLALKNHRTAWDFSRFGVAGLGVVASVSNMCVYFCGVSIPQYFGVV